jgi:cell fate (sporulation/competence/biofilm development) regulator YlbF (YheA/YmcA/DUF963 family)
MSRKLSEEEVKKGISVLKAQNSYSVSALAQLLEISRPKLYREFKYLLSPLNKVTEERVRKAIRELQLENRTQKLNKRQVAERAGISATTLYGNYSHLFPYIEGKKKLEESSTAEHVSESTTIALLKRDIIKLNERHTLEIQEIKNKIFTTLMVRDIGIHNAQETYVSFNKLQTQNDELKKQGLQQQSENALLRCQLVETKNNAVVSTSQTKFTHYQPKYQDIDNKLEQQELIKRFITAEKTNLENAIDACIQTGPDVIILFQNSLSCSLEDIPFHIIGKKVIVITSNSLNSKSFKELIESVPSIPVRAFAVDNVNVANMKFYCRREYGADVFSDAALECINDKLLKPSAQDGFDSVCSFKLPSKLRLVR